MQRCTALGARFGEHERAVGKIEGGQALAARQLGVPRGRQCSRPAIIKCNTSQRSPSTPMAMRLPMRRSSRDDAALHIGEGGLRGTKQKRTGQSHALNGLRDDARFQCAEVGGDVRQFGHE